MFRQVILPPGIAGVLFLHSMPGRYEPINQFNAEITRLCVRRIICLAPLDEIKRKSEHYFLAIQTGDLPCEHESFKVQDFQAPDDRKGFFKLVKDVAHRLESGEKILIHCAGGVGRTGMLAVCVLLALGIELQEALTTVSQSGSHLETEKQLALVRWVAGQFQGTRGTQGS